MKGQVFAGFSFLLVLGGCASPAPSDSSERSPGASAPVPTSPPYPSATQDCPELARLERGTDPVATTDWSPWPGGSKNLLLHRDVAAAGPWAYRLANETYWATLVGTTCPYAFESFGLQLIVLAYDIHYSEFHRSTIGMWACGQAFRDYLFDVRDHRFHYSTWRGVDYGERANVSDAWVLAMGRIRNPETTCDGHDAFHYGSNGGNVTISLHDHMFRWNETFTIQPEEAWVGSQRLAPGEAYHRTLNVTVECREACHATGSDHASHAISFYGDLWMAHAGFWPHANMVRH